VSVRPARSAISLVHEAAGLLRDVWRLDAEPSTIPMKAGPLTERRGRIRGLRHLFQAFTAIVVLWIGYDFVRWVRGLEAGISVGSRPPGVEGFLPIAALMSLRHLWDTGEVHPVHPAGLVILLAVLATGILLKKAFCSWLCPVGTLSEMLGAVGMAAFGRRLKLPRPLDVPLRGLKYLLLIFFLNAIFVVMKPEGVAAFLDSPYSRVADVKMLYFFERLTPLALQLLAGLVFFSMIVPFLWCRYLCPYGALLGALSLLSPLKVTRHAASCIDCALCARACRPTCRWIDWRGSAPTSASAACPASRRVRSRGPCRSRRLHPGASRSARRPSPRW